MYCIHLAHSASSSKPRTVRSLESGKGTTFFPAGGVNPFRIVSTAFLLSQNNFTCQRGPTHQKEWLELDSKGSDQDKESRGLNMFSMEVFSAIFKKKATKSATQKIPLTTPTL
jgi:hypothetical protein